MNKEQLKQLKTFKMLVEKNNFPEIIHVIASPRYKEVFGTMKDCPSFVLGVRLALLSCVDNLIDDKEK